jgi:hypothetical protein
MNSAIITPKRIMSNMALLCQFVSHRDKHEQKQKQDITYPRRGGPRFIPMFCSRKSWASA